MVLGELRQQVELRRTEPSQSIRPEWSISAGIANNLLCWVLCCVCCRAGQGPKAEQVKAQSFVFVCRQAGYGESHHIDSKTKSCVLVFVGNRRSCRLVYPWRMQAGCAKCHNVD